MMNRLQAVSLKFTLEEILVLLEALGMSSSAGLDTAAVDQLSERERALVLDVARRGLLARQMLTRTADGRLEVSQMAVAALGVSLAPTRSVLVTAGQSRTTAEGFLFHTAQNVYVTHDIEDDGSHQFYLMLDDEIWRQSILSAAGLGENGTAADGAAGPTLSLSSNDLNSAFDKAQSGSVDEAAAILEARGLDAGEAGRFAAVLSAGVTFATVTSIDHAAGEQRIIKSFVKGGDWCWKLDMKGSAQDAARAVEMVPITLQNARQEISAIIG